MVPFILNLTVENHNDADDIITTILQDKLAACCQKIEIESAYTWKEKLISGKEILILIKTFEHLVPKIEKVCDSKHSYETFELVGYKMDYVNEKYLEWMKKECKKQ